MRRLQSRLSTVVAMNDTEYPLPNISTDLAGQVALVTGATSGLGRRFAMVLAASGAKVIGTGRRQERLDELVAEIEAAGGVAAGVAMDMTDTASILAGAEAAQAAFGTITILVNNAGVPDAQRAHKMSIDLIDTVFDTNLRGPYVLSCEVARRLIEEKSPGRIVNISSISATHYDGHGAALYSITKAGITRMTEVLAVEWSRNHINVTGIAPGAFHSEMMDGMMERMGDFSGAMPRKRLGDPAQLDSTLLYLCSPASDAVTGTVIKVDDGQGPR
jgi:NAD(P)-dependent dehydrogenase (short-subunit alcohol dehydrogenase family)